MAPEFKKKAIKPTKTVGQRIKEARLLRKLTLESIEEQTNVRLKYLRAIERDQHHILPTEVYTLGFVRCFGEAVGLNPKKLVDQYRLEQEAVKTAKGDVVTSLSPTGSLKQATVLITPRILFFFGSGLVVLALISYIASGVRSFLAPPLLVIKQPASESRTMSSQIEVVGQSDPAVSLTVNGELISVEPTGYFKQQVAVIPGLNTLEFAAINRVGKETKRTIKVLSEYVVNSPTPAPAPSTSSATTPSPLPTASPKTN